MNEEQEEQRKKDEAAKKQEDTSQDAYYAQLLQLSNENKKYRGALASMLDCGFKDFQKNLNLLIVHNGSLEMACAAILEQ